MQEIQPHTALDLTTTDISPYSTLFGKFPQHHMVCSRPPLLPNSLSNFISADHPLTNSFYSRTWDVPKLIQGAEEADGAA